MAAARGDAVERIGAWLGRRAWSRRRLPRLLRWRGYYGGYGGGYGHGGGLLERRPLDRRRHRHRRGDGPGRHPLRPAPVYYGRTGRTASRAR